MFAFVLHVFTLFVTVKYGAARFGATIPGGRPTERSVCKWGHGGASTVPQTRVGGLPRFNISGHKTRWSTQCRVGILYPPTVPRTPVRGGGVRNTRTEEERGDDDPNRNGKSIFMCKKICRRRGEIHFEGRRR